MTPNLLRKEQMGDSFTYCPGKEVAMSTTSLLPESRAERGRMEHSISSILQSSSSPVALLHGILEVHLWLEAIFNLLFSLQRFIGLLAR